MRFYLAVIILFSSHLLAANKQIQDKQTKNKSKVKYEIVIHGNKNIKDSQYLSALSIKVKSFYEFWKDDKNYIAQKAIPTIKNTIRLFLDSKGYYTAKIKVNKDQELVTVNVDEGKPVVVNRLEINSDFDIDKIVTFKKGSNFEASKFVSIKRNIKARLMKAGYCNYKLDTKAYVDLATKSASLKYQVRKGGLCYFGDTTITSKPENISDRVIKSRMQYKKGDVFNTEKIARSYNMLNQLDAFGSGAVTPAQKVGNIVPIEIGLSKKENLNVFRGGVGYDTSVGPRAQLFYERRNFLGNARKLTATLQESDKSKYAKLSLFSPAFLSIGGLSLDLFSSLGYGNYKYDTYEENKGYQNVKLGYQKDEISLYTGLAIENIDIKLRSVDPSIVAGNFLLLYPFMEFTYDARDSKINPKNGYYLSAYTEYGLDYKAGASNYLKFLLEGRYIKTFGDLTLASVGKVGVIDSISGQIPASKLFYAGGAYSNRAYGENEIGVTTSPTSTATIGGKTWLNLSAEADYKLYGDLYGAAFFDSTMINQTGYDFNGETINSVGLGIRYMTPIGPLKLDVAMNTEDKDQYGIQFQIGQSF